jgi:hypothetical protein
MIKGLQDKGKQPGKYGQKYSEVYTSSNHTTHSLEKLLKMKKNPKLFV